MARLQAASTFQVGSVAFPVGGTSTVWKVTRLQCRCNVLSFCSLHLAPPAPQAGELGHEAGEVLVTWLPRALGGDLGSVGLVGAVVLWWAMSSPLFTLFQNPL